MTRPAVDIVIPFGGAAGEIPPLLGALAALELGEDDLIILADNTPEALLTDAEGVAGRQIRVVAARGERSSYHARNAGVAAGESPWLLFTDADCVPAPGVLDAFFESAVEERVGIVAGAVRSLPGQEALAARYAASRGHIGEGFHLAGAGPSGDGRRAGVTANLLVRRAAFEQLGGFAEGVVSGADVEFCLRAQEAGWRLLHRPGAFVEHRHPETVEAMLAKARRHGAGRAWLNERFPGAALRPPIVRPYLRGPVALAALALTGRRRRARFKLLDIRHSTALLAGYLRGDNAAEPFPQA